MDTPPTNPRTPATRQSGLKSPVSLSPSRFPQEAYPHNAPWLVREVLQASGDESLEGDGVELDRLLEQAVEDEAAVAGAAAVETEDELLQVAIELARLDAAVVGAEQPTFEQRA